MPNVPDHSLVYFKNGFLYYRNTAGNEVGINLDRIFPTSISASFYSGGAPSLSPGGSLTCYLAADIGLYSLGVGDANGTDANMGIVDWYFNGLKIISGQDWYTASPDSFAPSPNNIPVKVTVAGLQEVRIVSVGKNASSSGYVCGPRNVFLTVA